MKLTIFLTALLHNGILFAQPVTIQLNPVFGKLPLELNKSYAYKNDSIQITVLKFYISGIEFFKDEKPVPVAIKKFHLVDLANKPSLVLKSLDKNKRSFNRIKLSVGVDSLTNVSGAHGNDLDPVNGMYWTWQSGYINLKLEGKTKICPSRNNEFIFHIGGYQYPNNSIQHINLNIIDKKSIVINIDIADLLKRVNLQELYHLMSPGAKAVEMAQQISGIFKTDL